MKTTLVLTALLLVALVAAPALAQEGEREGAKTERQKILEKYDADGDGVLSPEERAKAMEARRPLPGPYPLSKEKLLKDFDADGDGTLSDEEKAKARESLGKRGGGRGARRPMNREEILKKYDADGDGTVFRTRLRDALRGPDARSKGGRPCGDRFATFRGWILQQAVGDGIR